MAKTKGSSGEAKSHVEYRNTTNGRFVSEGRAKNMNKENVVREHVPNPGHGDVKKD